MSAVEHSHFVTTAVGGGIAAAASLLGVALVHFQPVRTRANALGIAAFAAGVILGASFLHLLPEAIERAGAGVMNWALAAFFVLYVLETHLVPHAHHDGAAHEDKDRHGHLSAAARHGAVPAEAHAAHIHASEANGSPLAWIAIIAFGLHSAFDGLALGVGFSPDVSLGASTGLGVLAHKIPEGIALGALLFRAGLSAKRVIVAAGSIAFLTPLSGIGALFLVTDDLVAPATMGRLLALVAGSFVYIAAADLLPEVAHHPRVSRTVLMLAGIGVSLVVRTLVH